MTDGYGRTIAVWLPERQSDEFLRQEISRGNRTAECWSAIKARNERVQAAMRAIAKLKAERAAMTS
jgi:hypothetical protein